MNDKWRELIDNPPKGLDAIADLFDLSTNHEYPTPATLFIDLIGYTTEEYGYVLVKDISVYVSRFNYLELGRLGQALDDYTDRPQEGFQYVSDILEAEMDD
jgi:hypothetical protein